MMVTSLITEHKKVMVYYLEIQALVLDRDTHVACLKQFISVKLLSHKTISFVGSFAQMCHNSLCLIKYVLSLMNYTADVLECKSTDVKREIAYTIYR